MSDDESDTVESEATDTDEEDELEEEVCAQDASAASTSASTPQPVAAPAVALAPEAAKLQELLQLRAKAAIEGAKTRNVVRENQRLADSYTLSLLKRITTKIGWVEEERANRERAKKQSASRSSAGDRPSRRRERKREFRRQQADYEEVPGGGQFLMMMLSKNNQPENDKDDSKGASSLGGDPAILQISMGRPDSIAKGAVEASGPGKPLSGEKGAGKAVAEKGAGKASAEKGVGKVAAAEKGIGKPILAEKGTGKAAGAEKGPGKAVFAEKGVGKIASAEKGFGKAASEKGAGKAAPIEKGTGKGAAAEKGAGKATPIAGRQKGGGKDVPRPDPPAPTSSLPGFSSAPPGLGSPVGKGAGRALRARMAGMSAGVEVDAKSSQPHGSPGGQQLNLQSLLRGAGIEQDGLPDVPKFPSPEKPFREAVPKTHVSKASANIFGKLQKLVNSQEDQAPQQAPGPVVIPQMPGFSTIWGSPGSGPSASPANSPWGGPARDPWALPDPVSAVGARGGAPPGLAAAAGFGRPPPPPPPPPGGNNWQQAPEALEATSGAAPSRGRRGGRNRDRDRREEAEIHGGETLDDGRGQFLGARTKDEDLWDMPQIGNCTKGAVMQSDMDLPAFFRDTAAPAFFDHVLEGRGTMSLELEIEPTRPQEKANGRANRQKHRDAFDDSASKACLGSFSFDDDDDVRPPILFQ